MTLLEDTRSLNVVMHAIRREWLALGKELGIRELTWLDRENRLTDWMCVDSIRERALAAQRGEWLR